MIRSACFQNSDAVGSRSQRPHLLLSRVRRPGGAVGEDRRTGDPVQVGGRSVDVASRLGKMSASQSLETFIEKEKLRSKP